LFNRSRTLVNKAILSELVQYLIGKRDSEEGILKPAQPIVMKTENHYAPVSEAITKLRGQGFDLDFCIEGNHITSGEEKFDADSFEIADIYRYEGDSDPGDEAVVYALESKSGKKGILVTGMGMYSDGDSLKLLQKLHHRIK
jgi:hypothetical protein